MTRLSLIAALAAAGFAAPALASTYSASLAAPAEAKIIARDIVWNCGPAACQGTTQYGSPVNLCQSLAKKAGRIDRFVVDGRALSAEQLDRCNAAAKATPDLASASN